MIPIQAVSQTRECAADAGSDLQILTDFRAEGRGAVFDA